MTVELKAVANMDLVYFGYSFATSEELQNV